MELIFEKEIISGLTYNVDSKEWSKGLTTTDIAKYFKGKYSNIERFKDRYIEPKFGAFFNDPDIDIVKDLKTIKDKVKIFLDELLSEFEKVERFTYKEVFQLEESFQNIVWDTIDIGEMITNMNGKRVKVEGKRVNHKRYDKKGNFVGYEEYDSIYELWEADASILNDNLTDEKVYAVKCWCTSTNKEHFIWVEDKYKDSPLEAIASTVRVHENLIPHIKEIKRQGDVLLIEMKEGYENLVPEGEEVPLTSEQYFSLLTAQT